MRIIEVEPGNACAHEAGAVVALGCFDGVHLGHQALVRRMIGAARRARREAAVLTFEPHPVYVLGQNGAFLLTTLDEKAELLHSMGVDRLLLARFTREFAEQSPAVFARTYLKEALGAAKVFVGFNFTFGKGGGGDPSLLVQLGRQLGFEVYVCPPVRIREQVVSSTLVRALLLEGRVEQAQAMLGRPHFLTATVVGGRGRGRKLGFPTINLQWEAAKLLPAPGVYAAEVRLPHGGRWPAVANVGYRPTFGGGELVVEAHLMEFQGTLYGQTVRLFFRARIRPEERFPSAEALRRQIARDVATARAILQGRRCRARPMSAALRPDS